MFYGEKDAPKENLAANVALLYEQTFNYEKGVRLTSYLWKKSFFSQWSERIEQTSSHLLWKPRKY